MPLQATSGAASYDAFGGGVPVVPNFIEEVFSTYLYTGNDATQNIVNGIDLSTKGGMIWFKDRGNPYSHYLVDTVRGRTSLASQTTDVQTPVSDAGNDLASFNTNGFTVGTANWFNIDGTGRNYVSWTFRKQPKFFDVLTYTGTGSNTTIAHSLGSVPSSIWVKRTDTTGAWQVYHRSLANTEYLVLNTNAAKATGTTRWNSTTPTSTVFSLGTDATVNDSGGTYVAYIFAHDAGGFGLTGTDNVISCGSFTTDGSASATVNLGYEPQWVMIKSSSNTGNWFVIDNMRNFSRTVTAALQPNTSNAEIAGFGDATYSFFPTATGFESVQDLASSQTYIYIAIRRGPMAVPTVGTSVFAPVTDTGTSAAKSISAGLTVDAGIRMDRQKLAWSPNTIYDRLQGSAVYMNTTGTAGNNDFTPFFTSFDQNGITLTNSGFNSNTTDYINYFFKRAPSVFDVVCYTGTGANTTQTHNLGVVPELMIGKSRSNLSDWPVYVSSLGPTKHLLLNNTNTVATGSNFWNSTAPTSSVFSVGTANETNGSARTYVFYLFATCAGVSKVGSFTGNGTTQTIDCGFTGGARFVLIKRTDVSGGWYVYDTARGMTVLTDPYLLLNSTAAESATLGSVTTVSTGFALDSTILAAININAGTYIFLAIA